MLQKSLPNRPKAEILQNNFKVEILKLEFKKRSGTDSSASALADRTKKFAAEYNLVIVGWESAGILVRKKKRYRKTVSQ